MANSNPAPKGAKTNAPKVGVNNRVANAKAQAQQQIEEEAKRYKANVLSGASKELTKSNGKPYVLFTCEAFNSKGESAKVTAQRNVYKYEDDGETIATDEAGDPIRSRMPEIGDECQVIENIVDGDDGKPVRFFTMSLGVDTASQEELAEWAD